MPALSPWEMAGVAGAGVVAGAINTVVGSGSLLTFPTLLAFGYRPLVANVSNTVGLVPGSISGAIGYRAELHGQRDRVRRLSVVSIIGGLLGAVLLLVLPSASFEKVVPFLVLVACALVVASPRLGAAVSQRRTARGIAHEHGYRDLRLATGVFCTAVYGGYFGAAQGVILIALLGIFVDDGLQRLNALKNVLAALVNGVAAIVFVIFSTSMAWLPAGLLAVGATIGGQLGAHLGRRIPAGVLRLIIVVVGVIVAVKLFLAYW